MVLVHAFGFAHGVECLLAAGVLGGYARGAAVGVARQRLDAAQREHKAPRTVAPIGTQRHHAHDVKSADDLARRAQFDLPAQARADQGVMYQLQTLLQGHTHMVGEFRGCGARATLFTVNDDKVRHDASLEHGFDDGKPLPRVTQAKLEAHRLAARQLAQLGDKLQQLDRRAKSAVRSGRDAIDALGDAARGRDLGRYFGGGQDAALAGLSALAQLDLYHLDLWQLRAGLKSLGIKTAIGIAAAKVARAYLPDQIAAMLAVVLADRAFAGVVRKATCARARVECQDGIRTECAKTHGRDIEHTG